MGSFTEDPIVDGLLASIVGVAGGIFPPPAQEPIAIKRNGELTSRFTNSIVQEFLNEGWLEYSG